MISIANINGVPAYIQGQKFIPVATCFPQHEAWHHDWCQLWQHKQSLIDEITGRTDLWEKAETWQKAQIGCVQPAARTIYAVGLNYRDHVGETGSVKQHRPMIFNKWPSSLAGAYDPIPIGLDTVDYEVEMVLIIGKQGYRIKAEHAWQHIAGVTIGQDISCRALQVSNDPAQFTLGKSLKGYAPIGPAVWLTDEQGIDSEISIYGSLNGETVQQAQLNSMIFSIEMIMEYLSYYTELMPGDLIFTGTPSGVGMARGRYLEPGDLLQSGCSLWSERMENKCVADPLASDEWEERWQSQK